MLKLKKLVRLNLDDLIFYLAVEGGIFLLLELVICCVMRFERPEDSLTVSSILLPIVGGFLVLIFSAVHVCVNFEQALCFGQTRRRALGLTLGLICFEEAFVMAVAALLTALERFVCPHLWAALAGADRWVLGITGGVEIPVEEGASQTETFFVNAAGELLPLPENTLLINTFTLDWYWWLLIAALSVCGGLIIGAVCQRFGSKGGWFLWGICMASVFLGQLLPQHSAFGEILWILPLMTVLLLAGVLWSVWSMLHAVVKH